LADVKFVEVKEDRSECRHPIIVINIVDVSRTREPVRLCEVNSAWTWFNWNPRWLDGATRHDAARCGAKRRGAKRRTLPRRSSVAWLRVLSQEVHWLAEWRKQL